MKRFLLIAGLVLPLLSFGQMFGGGGSSPSTPNTTVVPLDSGDTFTGTNVRAPNDVLTSLQTDVDGILYYDFSVDGENYNTFPPEGFEVLAGIHEFHTAVSGGRLFRVRFVNTDTGDASYMRLYTYTGRFRQGNLPVNSVVGKDADATVVRSTDFETDVAAGLYAGYLADNKFGYHEVTTTLEPLTSSGFYRTPKEAVSLEAVSSSAADDTADVGAHEIVVVGLDSLWRIVRDTVPMDGLTAVPLSIPMTRVYRTFISESGTYATADSASHQGTITVRESGGGDTWVQISVYNSSYGLGQSLIGVTSIPENTAIYIYNINITVESNKTVDLFLFKREDIDDVTPPFSPVRVQERWVGIDNSFDHTYPVPIRINGAADVGFMARVISGTAKVSVDYDYILVFENATEFITTR